MDAKDTLLISFATPSHYDLQQELMQYSRHFGEIKLVRDTQIDPILKEAYPQVFQYKKYHGYFIWKAFLLYTNLFHTNHKYILYVDSNLRFTNIDKFLHMYSKWDGDVFIPKYNHYFNKDWTKRDTFIAMDADEPRYWNANQIWSVLMGFKTNNQNLALLNEYLDFCELPIAVTEEPNVFGKEDLSGFVEHRWEQSIMSILVEKYGIKCPLYNDFLDCVNKVYPKKILDLKKEWSDPLAKE